jgi:hypothetical protein
MNIQSIPVRHNFFYSDYKIIYEGRLQIEQTWTHISLFFEGSNAFSRMPTHLKKEAEILFN